MTYASHNSEHGGWNIYPACPPETLRAIMDACMGTTIRVTFQPRPHPADEAEECKHGSVVDKAA